MPDLTPGRYPELALELLHESPVNPRTITDDDFERLQHTMTVHRSLLNSRPLIATPDGEVLAGNMRLRAAGAMNWTTIPTDIIPEPSADERREIMLIDNAPFGQWVDDKLAAIVAAHANAGADLKLLGMRDAELASLLRLAREGQGGGPRRLGDPDAEPPAPPAEPKTRVGDVYRLGDHLLICGDATDPAVHDRLMGSSDADLLVTDPPYGVGYQRLLGRKPGEHATDADWAELRRRRAELAKRLKRRDIETATVANDDLDLEGTRLLISSALVDARLKDGGAYYVFSAAGGDGQIAAMLGLYDIGMPPRHGLVWVKDRFVLGQADYHYKHEILFYGWKPGAAHYFVADRTLHTAWEVEGPKASKLHPTMKPADLYRRAIRNSSRPGEVVLDCFAGSGTVLVACEYEKRLGRAIELDPRYCDVIVGRWEEMTGKTAELVSRLDPSPPTADAIVDVGTLLIGGTIKASEIASGAITTDAPLVLGKPTPIGDVEPEF